MASLAPTSLPPAATASSFVARALAVLERLAPLRLADTAWDNVGLLVEAPTPRAAPDGTANAVLLTVDLTPRVLAEAVADPSVALIVAYHPTIFRGWKRLNMFRPYASAAAAPAAGSLTAQDLAETVNQDTVLRLVAAGISLYSPHTAFDNRYPNGVNDWLATAFSGLCALRSVKPIIPHRGASSGKDTGEGSGRVIEFETPQTKNAVVAAIKKHLGLKFVQYGAPAAPERRRTQGAAPEISTVAICAGSGGSVFLSAQGPAAAGRVVADMYWSGELSHHDVLKLCATSHVVLCGHSNTERGFLRSVIAKELQMENIPVKISSLDCDPLVIE